MRILHVTKKYPNALGGDATAVSNLEKQQIKNGNEVFILTTNCDEIINKKNLIKFGLKDTPSGLDKITFKRIFSLIGLYFKSKKILKEIKPDVVHSHSVDMGFIMSKACRKLGVPIVNTFHSGFFSTEGDNFVRAILMKKISKYLKFDKMIAVNKKDVENNKSTFNNLVFVPNGIDLSEFDLSKKLKRKRNTLLFAGRVEEYKGLKYLFFAIKLIKDKIKNIKLIVVGEGSCLDEYKHLCKKLDIQKNVSFFGKLSPKKLIVEYQKSSVFVLPSYTSSETFGIVLLESLACKTPVITTNIVGISEEIEKQNCGIVVKPKNSQELEKTITKILGDPKLAKNMGENGRKLIKEKYGWEKVNRNLGKIYEEVLRE